MGYSPGQLQAKRSCGTALHPTLTSRQTVPHLTLLIGPRLFPLQRLHDYINLQAPPRFNRLCLSLRLTQDPTQIGLPNTADRIIDQAVSVKLYTCALAKHSSCFVLLSRLAKAFERVNPHWILLVLQECQPKRISTPHSLVDPCAIE